MLSIGLMSGTSMDGIDAALLQTDGEDELIELAHIKLNYSPEVQWLLKAAERAVSQAKGQIARANQFYVSALRYYLQDELHLTPLAIQSALSNLSQIIYPLNLSQVVELSTQLHADAVNLLLKKSQYQAGKIDVVGYHGQTVLHHPAAKIIIQLGDGQKLADLTGIRVVNNFRDADIAAGGQGAPFAPLYHQALAKRDGKLPVMVVNCGGIANVSCIPDDKVDNLIAFDTGPGNGLIDALVKQRTQGREAMDKDGQYGRMGQVNEDILTQLTHKAITKRPGYFNLRPPKSLDIRDFGLISALDALSLADACATLEYFTAQTIVNSVQLIPHPQAHIPRHWILAGGGWHNPIIRNHLTHLLYAKLGADVVIETATEAGWTNDAIEAQIFAYFAVRRLKNLPLSVPSTTGVSHPISGGVLHEPSYTRT